MDRPCRWLQARPPFASGAAVSDLGRIAGQSKVPGICVAAVRPPPVLRNRRLPMCTSPHARRLRTYPPTPSRQLISQEIGGHRETSPAAIVRETYTLEGTTPRAPWPAPAQPVARKNRHARRDPARAIHETPRQRRAFQQESTYEDGMYVWRTGSGRRRSRRPPDGRRKAR